MVDITSKAVQAEMVTMSLFKQKEFIKKHYFSDKRIKSTKNPRAIFIILRDGRGVDFTAYIISNGSYKSLQRKYIATLTKWGTINREGLFALNSLITTTLDSMTKTFGHIPLEYVNFLNK